MNTDELQHMVKMINQISINIPRNLSDQEAADKIASHITSFWAKSMRTKICQNWQSVNDDLTPTAQLALEKIRARMNT